MSSIKWHIRGGTLRGMQWLKTLLLGLCLGTLISCETLVNTIPQDKLPKADSQLTMFCFLSPQDTIIRVKVSQTSPLFSEYTYGGNSYFIVNGDTTRTGDALATATVTISDGATKATLPFQPEGQLYAISSSQFPIEAGKTYSLTVTDGKRTAQASCTVPSEAVRIKEFSLDTFMVSNFGNRDTMLVTSFTWNDPTGKANYYRVKVYEDVEIPTFTFDPKDKKYTEGRARVQLSFSSRRDDGRSDLLNDTNLDGKTFSSPQFERRIGTNVNYYPLPVVDGKRLVPERGPVSLGLYLLLNTTDQPYYEYHRSLRQARNDNPFTEPSLVYTNVKGGLGIFAGYNQSIRIVKP